MLGLLRTAISVLFVSLAVWCAFTVPLGRRTFADHVDRIGQTREAEELIQGARSRVRPLLEEVKHRFLGEYVEAPTYLPAATPSAPGPAAPGPARVAAPEPASPPSTAAPAPPAPAAAVEEGGSIYARGRQGAPEPALPGRRRRDRGP